MGQPRGAQRPGPAAAGKGHPGQGAGQERCPSKAPSSCCPVPAWSLQNHLLPPSPPPLHTSTCPSVGIHAPWVWLSPCAGQGPVQCGQPSTPGQTMVGWLCVPSSMSDSLLCPTDLLLSLWGQDRAFRGLSPTFLLWHAGQGWPSPALCPASRYP